MTDFSPDDARSVATASSTAGAPPEALAFGRDALDQPVRQRPTIVSTINFKGGVGKTTSCLNLAAAAYEEGLSSLILDLDPQGSATEFAELDRGHKGPTLYDWFARRASLQEAAVEIRDGAKDARGGARGCIFLCPADERLTKIQNLLYSEKTRSYLKEALTGGSPAKKAPTQKGPGPLRGSDGEPGAFLNGFDFVFLDVPPSVSALSENVIQASDLALMVLSCQFMSLNGLRRLTQIIRRAESVGAAPDWYILPTFYRPTEIESSLVWSRVAEVVGVYPEGRLLSPIGRFAAFGQAFQVSKSIFEYDALHQGAKHYSAAFAEIQNAAQKPRKNAASPRSSAPLSE